MKKQKEDIMINNYNYSEDVRNWEAKYGKGMFSKHSSYVDQMKCSILDNK